MNHWRARRALAQLLDETLSPGRRRALGRHLDRCPSCREELESYRLAERLVSQLPPSVAPLEFDPAAHRRLARLARWSMLPALPRPGGWRGPALGVLGVAAVVTLAITASSWTPISADASTLQVAMAPPDPGHLPVHWRPGR